MPVSPKGRRDEEPLSASRQAALRRLRRVNFIALPGAVIVFVLNFIQNPPLPTVIAKLVIMVILVAVIGTAVVRFSIWQRNEYWRERGRDPKHPERFPGGQGD